MMVHPKECTIWFLISICGFQITTGLTTGKPMLANEVEQDTRSKLDKLTYASYLKEVIEVLGGSHTSDQIDLTAILNFHHADQEVRDKLNKVKRAELNRIKKLKTEILKRKGMNQESVDTRFRNHVLYLDPDYAQFRTKDLQKLIVLAHRDLARLDEERHERFKEYEMYKQLEYEELLHRLTPEEQKLVLTNRKAAMRVHYEATPKIVPTSVTYLHEVWQVRDHMNKENFNLKTFFHLHDLDGNGMLDEDEIKTILQQMARDYHDPRAEGFDHNEADEELERLREFMFKEADYNRDHFVDLDEFIVKMKNSGLHDHMFWTSLKTGPPVFTEEEYKKFKEAHGKIVKRMADEGFIEFSESGFVVLHDDNRWNRWRKENPGKELPRAKVVPTATPSSKVHKPVAVQARKEKINDVDEDNAAE